MIVAFHFRADSNVYGPVWIFAIQEKLLRCLTDRQAHAVISSGDLLVHHGLGPEGNLHRSAAFRSLHHTG